jgi:ATP-dependent 26S proteasome regulatory subunit
MNLMRGIDLKKIAEKMNGASGAELKVGTSIGQDFNF